MTTKKTATSSKATSTTKSVPARQTGHDHKWQGQGVEPGSRVAESPEAAATRAEGNALAPVGGSGEPGAAVTIKSTLVPDGRKPEKGEDDPENAEEKRQAAVEEHADASPKHFPHGRL